MYVTMKYAGNWHFVKPVAGVKQSAKVHGPLVDIHTCSYTSYVFMYVCE